MKPKTKEQKTEKKKSETDNLKIGEARFFFSSAIVIIFVLIFSIVFFNTLFNGDQQQVASETCVPTAVAKDIKISTDKAQYMEGEKISLHIENLGSTPVYSEPCKSVNVFERRENGGWTLEQGEDTVISYRENGFEKKEGNTDCRIDLPINGVGTYRVVVPIFYGCTQPSHYACKGSEIFRSNEFEITAEAPVSSSTGL